MRLWLKIAIAGLVLLAAVLLVVYQTASQLLSATVIQQLRARGDELGRPLAAALVTPLLQQDFATAQAVLDDVTAAGHVKLLRLSDARNQVLASSGGDGQPPVHELATPYVDGKGGLCMDFQIPLDASGQHLGMLRYALSAQALTDSLASWRRQVLQISVLGVLVLGVLVVLASRWLAGPLQRLSEAAQHIQHGRYDMPLPAGGPDEIGRLAASLGALRDAIRERVGQLHQARDAAEAANRAKSAFLANTSHELRTPLNGVLGMARLARQPGLDTTRRQRYLDLLVDSAKSLADILSDTLDLAKIEAGKLVLELQPFDPRAMLAATLTSYRPLADSTGLALEVQVDAAVPALVLGDALRVRQILVNYLGNALKFTPQGMVQVRLTVVGENRLRLAVQDTGVGLPADVQRRLFTPFTQADASTTRRHGGTGLGLAICRELAQRMDGEVGVDSAPDEGSTFWAELRLPAVAGATAAPCQPRNDTPSLQGARALVVEDNPVNRILAVSLLENWGMVTAQAEDGQQAVDAVARAEAAGTPFDIVLMDLQMPVMDGYEAARLLRLDPQHGGVPIIALTAHAMESENCTTMWNCPSLR
jgi:signal transduction histidine kinase/energy-converting hydrogenase Eha subunit C